MSRPPVPLGTQSKQGVTVDRSTLSAQKYVEPLLSLFRDELGNSLPPAVIYCALREAGILNKIHGLRTGKRGNQPFDEVDTLSPMEQAEKQKKQLYEKAMTGDVAAKKLWFELNSEQEKEQVYNVSFHIKDYKIKDVSLRRIAAMSERHFVSDLLKGLRDRLEMDEAPPELIARVTDLDETFMAWAYEAYAPKNG